MSTSSGRNAPCACGSGKRYKHCCGVLPDASPSSTAPVSRSATAEPIDSLLARAVDAYNRLDFRLALGLGDAVLAAPAADTTQRLAAAEITGSACTRMNQHLRAKELYLLAHSLAPGRHQTLQNLGMNAGMLEEFERAVGYWQELLALEPGNLGVCRNLAVVLRKLGRWREAKALYERIIAGGHADEATGASYLMSLHYNARNPDEFYAAHLAWAARFAPASNMAGRIHRNERTSTRRIRLGYFSPDFSRKVAGHFARPLIAHHDRTRFELYLYSNTAREDDYTEYFRSNCDKWTDVRQMDPQRTADTIAADRIDVMVDLAGHAEGNILPALSYKPAPVQITMLDYFDTTGVAAIDYFVSDAYHSPADSSQRFLETLVRLPGLRLCYSPVDGAPPVSGLPALRNGAITFGSFNRRDKLTQEVVALWSRVLRAVETSRLLLKGSFFDKTEIQRSLLRDFAACGIAGERIEFRGRSGHREALAQYADMDIALDTFPWNGGLTTCEALLMGVPVITLQGERILGRQSAAMMHALGLDDFIAEDSEHYVEIARRAAADVEALARLRRDLRDRLLGSPLCDGPGYTRSLEAVYSEAWRKWCAGERPGG